MVKRKLITAESINLVAIERCFIECIGNKKAAVMRLFVENIGVEPMTSCMPCKRSSQLS